MGADFDPYSKWLGIGADELRPLDYYRLLGISRFENDPDVIAINADRQIDHVRKFSRGPHGELAEQLVNRLTQARLTLLKPEKKLAYDQQLIAKDQHANLAASAALAPVNHADEQGFVDQNSEQDDSLAAKAMQAIRGRLLNLQHGGRWPKFAALLFVTVVAVILVVVLSGQNNSLNSPVAVESDPTAGKPANTPGKPVKQDEAKPKPVENQPAAAKDAELLPEAPQQAEKPNNMIVAPQGAVPKEMVPPDPAPVVGENQANIPGAEPPAVVAEEQKKEEQKLPVPLQAKQDEVQQLLSELYNTELLNAKKSTEKSELARKLIQTSKETTDDNAARYGLLVLARDLTIAAGDADTALATTDLMTTEYQLDSLTERIETLEKCTKISGISKTSLSRIVAIALAAADDLATDDEYEAAIRYARIALESANEAKDNKLINQVIESGKELTLARSQYADLKLAETQLAVDPENPAANLTLGRWYWFRKEDPERAMLHLAKTLDSPLKIAAEQDLLLPAEPAAQLELADQWWSLSQMTADESAKSKLVERALSWYQAAHPRLTGLQKIKAEKRIAEIVPQIAPKTKPATQKVTNRPVPGNKAPVGQKSPLDPNPPLIQKHPLGPKPVVDLAINKSSRWVNVKNISLENWKYPSSLTPDHQGLHVAVCGSNKIEVFDTISGKSIVEATLDSVSTAAFSPADDVIYYSSTAKKLKAIEIKTRRQILDVGYPKPSSGSAESRCSWSDDCSTVAYITTDNKTERHPSGVGFRVTEFRNTIEVLDLQTKSVVRSINKGLPSCRMPILTGDKRWVAAGSKDAAYIWDVRSGNLICEMGPEEGLARKLFFSRDNQYCFSATGKYTDASGLTNVTVYEVPKARKVCSFQIPTTVGTLQSTTDNKYLIVPIANGTISIRELKTGNEISKAAINKNQLIDARLLPGNKFAVLTSDRGSIENANYELSIWKTLD